MRLVLCIRLVVFRNRFWSLHSKILWWFGWCVLGCGSELSSNPVAPSAPALGSYFGEADATQCSLFSSENNRWQLLVTARTLPA